MKPSVRNLLSGMLCLCALPLSVQAYEYRDSSYKNLQPPPAGKQHHDHMTMQEITPNAGPRVANGADVFLTADFIYWRPREDGTAFAISGADIVNNTFVGSGQVHKPDFSFEPGFKVGLGLNLGHDGWDLFAEYTWLRSHSNRSSLQRDSNDTSNARPTWIVIAEDGAAVTRILIGSNVPLLFGKGSWDFHFNIIDLELGRNFYISQYLTLRPHFGLKGAWNYEKYRVRYITDFDFAADPKIHKMRINQDVWGIGIRAGLDTAWHLGAGFSIFGDFALSNLWTDFEVDRKDKSFEIGSSTEFVTTFDTQNDFHPLIGILEADLGIRWETWWKNDDYHFSLQAAWEEQIWWSYNNYISLSEESAHGDLSLHGLTIKARFDF